MSRLRVAALVVLLVIRDVSTALAELLEDPEPIEGASPPEEADETAGWPVPPQAPRTPEAAALEYRPRQASPPPPAPPPLSGSAAARMRRPG